MSIGSPVITFWRRPWGRAGGPLLDWHWWQAWFSSHRTRDHRWPCVQFNCSSNMEQFVNGSAVFRVTGHLSTPPENWTVRAFLQLTPRLSGDFTAAWLTFTFPQLFAVAAILKSIDYNVAMTFILLLIIIMVKTSNKHRRSITVPRRTISLTHQSIRSRLTNGPFLYSW